MTYKEIKDRLSKCELTLEKIKSGKITDLKPADLKKKTAQLEVLRESYIKQLKEAQEKTYLVTPKSGKTAALSLGDDEVDALKDADDIDKIKSSDGTEVKEQEGVKFSVDETKAIAKSVGKAVAMSLKALGDSVSSMKAKDIEESSFEIYVQYKNGSDDQFSFYIVEDTLHLQDFSFDKELVDVGVKPSGEAIVNVDVLSNELQKHFKSLNETEVNEAPENMYYFKVPRTDKAKLNAAQNTIETLYNPVRFADIVDDDGAGNVVMYIHKKDFDPGMIDDLQGDGIDLSSSNFPGINEEDVKQIEAPKAQGDLDIGHQDDEPSMLKASAFETAEYAAKLVKKLAQYDKHDGEVDFPNWWQKKLILARDYMSAAFHYLDSEEKQPAIDQLALEAQSHPVMVQQRIAHAKKAKEKAKEKETVKEDWGGSDQAAMNQQIHKELGSPKKMPSPFDDKLEYVVQDAVDFHWDDWPEYQTDREGLYTQAKRAYLRAYFKDTFNKMVQMFEPANEGKYKSDAQRKAIHAKKAEMNEASYDDAISELRDIVDRAVDLGEEAREVVRQYFPNESSRLEAYGAFDLVYSNNRYDTTLGKFVDRLEEEGYDDDMDESLNEGTDLYDRNGISIKRYFGGQDKGVMVQITIGSKYITVPVSEYPFLVRAMQSVQEDLKDMSRQLPRGKNMDEGIAKTQKAHGLVVAKMKELAKQYKAGDKSVVAQLKDLTAKKKQLEKQLEKDVAGKNRGQQLDTSINEYRGVGDDLVKIIKDKAEDSGFSHEEETQEIIEFLQGIEFDDNGNIDAVYEEYKGKHQGSNYKWPMSQATKDRKEADKAAQAAKKKPLKEEKSTCCGKCGRKHVKGTKCKTPYLKGKDHCRTR